MLAASQFDVVDFEVVRLESPAARQIRLKINGVDLVDLVGAYEKDHGLDPAEGMAD